MIKNDLNTQENLKFSTFNLSHLRKCSFYLEDIFIFETATNKVLKPQFHGRIIFHIFVDGDRLLIFLRVFLRFAVPETIYGNSVCVELINIYLREIPVDLYLSLLP